MTTVDKRDEITFSWQELLDLALAFLTAHGLSQAQASALANSLCKAQRDGCLSHGLQRLPGTLETMTHPAFNANSDPVPQELTPAITLVDADHGFSILAVERGLPFLVAGARQLGIAVLAINNGFHSTALWPVVEEIASQGLAGLSMNPTHDWVAPAGGTAGYPRDQPDCVFMAAPEPSTLRLRFRHQCRCARGHSPSSPGRTPTARGLGS